MLVFAKRMPVVSSTRRFARVPITLFSSISENNGQSTIDPNFHSKLSKPESRRSEHDDERFYKFLRAKDYGSIINEIYKGNKDPLLHQRIRMLPKETRYQPNTFELYKYASTSVDPPNYNHSTFGMLVSLNSRVSCVSLYEIWRVIRNQRFHSGEHGIQERNALDILSMYRPMYQQKSVLVTLNVDLEAEFLTTMDYFRHTKQLTNRVVSNLLLRAIEFNLQKVILKIFDSYEFDPHNQIGQLNKRPNCDKWMCVDLMRATYAFKLYSVSKRAARYVIAVNPNHVYKAYAHIILGELVPAIEELTIALEKKIPLEGIGNTLVHMKFAYESLYDREWEIDPVDGETFETVFKLVVDGYVNSQVQQLPVLRGDHPVISKAPIGLLASALRNLIELNHFQRFTDEIFRRKDLHYIGCLIHVLCLEISFIQDPGQRIAVITRTEKIILRYLQALAKCQDPSKLIRTMKEMKDINKSASNERSVYLMAADQLGLIFMHRIQWSREYLVATANCKNAVEYQQSIKEATKCMDIIDQFLDYPECQYYLKTSQDRLEDWYMHMFRPLAFNHCTPTEFAELFLLIHTKKMELCAGSASTDSTKRNYQLGLECLEKGMTHRASEMFCISSEQANETIKVYLRGLFEETRKLFSEYV